VTWTHCTRDDTSTSTGSGPLPLYICDVRYNLHHIIIWTYFFNSFTYQATIIQSEQLSYSLITLLYEGLLFNVQRFQTRGKTFRFVNISGIIYHDCLNFIKYCFLLIHLFIYFTYNNVINSGPQVEAHTSTSTGSGPLPLYICDVRYNLHHIIIWTYFFNSFTYQATIIQLIYNRWSDDNIDESTLCSKWHFH
jgi:hypothetical protein